MAMGQAGEEEQKDGGIREAAKWAGDVIGGLRRDDHFRPWMEEITGGGNRSCRGRKTNDERFIREMRRCMRGHNHRKCE